MSVIDRVKASISSRVIQPWQQKNFEKTQCGKELAKYKDKYKGRRCFFIGNGPSLRADDLTMLYKNGEITFAFNRVYHIFDKTPWRPDFYISQDEKMLRGCIDEVNALELPVKLIPIQLMWYHGLRVSDAVYFNMEWQENTEPKDFSFSDNIAHSLICGTTGMYTAAQIAVYMGFSEIYLIGVDHQFQISQNMNGEIIVDKSVKDYFSDNYNQDKKDLYIPNVERSTQTYMAMKRHCENMGVHVYNATRGGKLEVFLRCDFDSLFMEEK